MLGVDTIVALDGEIYGKPPDEDAARATLRRLGGRTHEVISGFALVAEDGDGARGGGGHRRHVPRARRRRRRLVRRPPASGEGRAGGYAIQGRGGALVERIDGDYLNVVGLPVATLLRPLAGPARIAPR